MQLYFTSISISTSALVSARHVTASRAPSARAAGASCRACPLVSIIIVCLDRVLRLTGVYRRPPTSSSRVVWRTPCRMNHKPRTSEDTEPHLILVSIMKTTEWRSEESSLAPLALLFKFWWKEPTYPWQWRGAPGWRRGECSRPVG